MDELDLMHYRGDQHYYETRLKQEHAHVICLRCGKVEEYFGEPLQEMRRQVESHFGFEIVLARTEIGGYCSHCQACAPRRWRQPRERHAGRAERLMQPATSESAVPGCLRCAAGALPLRPAHAASPSSPCRFCSAARPTTIWCCATTEPRAVTARIISEERRLRDRGPEQPPRHLGQRRTHRAPRAPQFRSHRFGVRDSYQLTFSLDPARSTASSDRLATIGSVARARSGPIILAKLRSLVEVARALQNSLSTQEVLTAVVDAALAVTGCERGFLLLRKERRAGSRRRARQRGQATRSRGAARARHPSSNARCNSRRDLLSMSFDPTGAAGHPAGNDRRGAGAAQRGLPAAGSDSQRIRRRRRAFFGRRQYRRAAVHGFAA